MNNKKFVPMVGATYAIKQGHNERLKDADIGRYLTVTDIHSADSAFANGEYGYVHGTFSDGGTTKDHLGGVWFDELGKMVAHPFTKGRDLEAMSKFGFDVGDRIYFVGKYGYGLTNKTQTYEVVALDKKAMEFTIKNGIDSTQVRNDPHNFKAVSRNTARRGYNVEVVEDDKDTKQTEGTFILWNPASDRAPKATYKTQEQALRVAESMAKRYPGETFFVMRALSKSVVQLEVVTLDV